MLVERVLATKRSIAEVVVISWRMSWGVPSMLVERVLTTERSAAEGAPCHCLILSFYKTLVETSEYKRISVVYASILSSSDAQSHK